MKRLYLMRHGKSGPPAGGQSDFSRVLAPRGREDAARMGRVIGERDFRPSIILCSTAARTRETLDILLPALDGPNTESPTVVHDAPLYLASADIILDRIAALGGANDEILVIGHNPGLRDCAALLTGSGDGKARHRLSLHFPAAALAVLTLPASGETDWNFLIPGDACLDALITPGDLRDDQG